MDNEKLMNILMRISKGDASAFQDLYQDYFKLIYGIAMSVLKDEDASLDVVQNVALNLYTLSSDKFPISAPMSWLYSVTKNEALHFLRKEHQAFPIEDALKIPADKNDIEAMIDLDSYYSTISFLKPQEQEIVTLKIISGLKYKEIAKLLNMPMGTVQWKFNVATKKLKIAMLNLLLAAFSFLGGYKYWANITSGSEVAGGNADEISTIIEMMLSHKGFVVSIAFTILFLSLSMYFFVKYIKIRQQKKRSSVSK